MTIETSATHNDGMSNIKVIRERLGLTQSALAAGIGCTQGNVGHYERGQAVPPDAAKRLIEYAKSLGYVITFNDVYMPELATAPATIAQEAIETVANTVQTTQVGALRTGGARRHLNRREKDGLSDLERRAKAGPPFQALESGVA